MQKKRFILEDAIVSRFHSVNTRKTAFTLAEVLITLGIIGVVAAITLPALIQKNNERVAVSQLKKVYSTISQAYLLAVSENGTPDNWDLKGYAIRDGAINLLKTLTPYMKTTKICDVKRDCFPNVGYKTLTGDGNSNLNTSITSAQAKLADGTLISAFVWDNECKMVLGTTKELQNVCGALSIDINGFNKPNQYGMDYFLFNITKYGVVPNGVPEMTTPNSFASSCRDRNRPPNAWSSNGDGCAAWVIFNENMDYLHCDDLSWNGKKTCK